MIDRGKFRVIEGGGRPSDHPSPPPETMIINMQKLARLQAELAVKSDDEMALMVRKAIRLFVADRGLQPAYAWLQREMVVLEVLLESGKDEQ